MERVRKPGGLVAIFGIAGVALLLVQAAGPTPANASAGTTSFNVASDFSATANPNGAWSYGWSATRGSTFNTFGTPVHISGMDFWTRGSGLPLEPVVSHNGTNGPITLACCVIPAGTLGMHPGPGGENAVVRWTASVSGSYQVSATFIGRDVTGTTSDVAVLGKGAQLFSGEVTGYLATQTFSGSISVQAGDIVDFTVGFGTDRNYFSDSTGLDATISALSTNPLVGLSPLDAARFLATEQVATAATQLAQLDPAAAFHIISLVPVDWAAGWLAAMPPAAAFNIVSVQPLDGAKWLAAMTPLTAYNIVSVSATVGPTLIGAMQPPAAVSVLDAGVTTYSIGPGTSLSSKLSAAQAALDRRSVNAGCGELNAFANQVRAQAGKSLTSSLASLLIQSAIGIQRSLGC